MTVPVTAPRHRTLGDFQLLAKLATGGMAEIYLARRQGDGPDGAVQVIKRILPHLADDDHFITMFRDEANLASQLVHPNICRVHELGRAGGESFIVMEYLHGVALSRLLSRLSKRRQFLDVRVVAGLVVQACAGLHHAHEARGGDGHPLGVVHRDVSPPNIVVTADGVVKLLDFGIAKARGANSKTRTGTVKGKNAYMSPEQILGKPLDRRSDVFALAAVMYELLSVRRLFHRDSDFLTFKAITEEPIPDIRDRRSDLPASLVAVLTRALARDPGARYATAAEMSAAIVAAVSVLGGPASPDELRAALARDFAEELTSKEELLAQAEQLGVGDGQLGVGDGQLGVGDGQLGAGGGPLGVGASLGGPRGTPGPGPRDSRPIAVAGRDGPDDSDFFQDKTPVARAPARPEVPAVPAGRGRPGPTRPPSVVVDDGAASSVMGAPTGVTMIDLADPTTDLLGAWRRRRVWQLAGAVAVIAIAIAAYVLTRGPGRAADGALAAHAADATAAAVDAGLVDAATDADPTRADIAALARYGFFSIGSDRKAEISIDHKVIGNAPLIRYPLSPGPHQIKAVSRGRAKRWEIMIEATKDVDLGVIEWGER